MRYVKIFKNYVYAMAHLTLVTLVEFCFQDNMATLFSSAGEQ
jgi:hypothetical protein